MELTDVEVICNWMEPKPDGPPKESWDSILAKTLDRGSSPATPKGWWRWTCVYEHGDEPELVPASLSLDRLWEVEERLGPAQQLRYSRDLNQILWPWHATAAMKIKILAAMFREEAGGDL